MENDINNAINSAKKKLAYLLNNLKNTTGFIEDSPRLSSITKQKYKDALWASRVLSQVDDVLARHTKKIPFTSSIDTPNLFKENIITNNDRKLINNKCLMQLLELQGELGEVIELLKSRKSLKNVKNKKLQRRKGVSNENKITLQLKHDSDEQKIRVERTRQRKQQNEKVRRVFNPLNDLIVMSAHTVHSPLIEDVSLDSMRKVKSSGMPKNKSVVNFDGVRNIIAQCIRDLDEVKDYLNKNPIEKSNKRIGACQCSRLSQGIDIQEGGSSNNKIVICMKGKEQECRGNLQITIEHCNGRNETTNSHPQIKKVGLDSNPMKNNTENFESDILHGQDLKCESEESSSNINIIFNTKNPTSSSTVEAPKSKQQVPIINMYETHDIPIVTENGEELIISLTVRPKKNDETIDIIDNDVDTTADVLVQKEDDDYIPLSRTKICSSMQFDVVVAESKMKEVGIKYDNNPNVDVKLQSIGVDNLLRASRPAKCGRQAVLNEITKDCLPYAPSLYSLPLEEFDTDIINQSLDMSLEKSKHSTIRIPKSDIIKTAYFMNLDENHRKFIEKKVFFLLVEYKNSDIIRNNTNNTKQHLIKTKLNFYINLDDHHHHKPNIIHFNIYAVNFFDLHKFKSNKSKKIPPNPSDNLKCIAPIQEMEENKSNDIFKDKIEKKKLSCHLIQLEMPKVERPNLYVDNNKSKCYKRPPSKIPVYRHKLIHSHENPLKFPLEGYDNGDTKQQSSPNRTRSELDASLHSHSGKDQFTSVVRRPFKIETHNIIDIRDRVNYEPHCSAKSEESNRFLSSCENNVKRIRKRRDFFTSRSQSEIITLSESKRKFDPLDNRNVRQWNEEVASSRFTKTSPSGLLVDYLANFLYDKFIRNLSRNAKEEILQNIEALSHP